MLMCIIRWKERRSAQELYLRILQISQRELKEEGLDLHIYGMWYEIKAKVFLYSQYSLLGYWVTESA